VFSSGNLAKATFFYTCFEIGLEFSFLGVNLL